MYHSIFNNITTNRKGATAFKSTNNPQHNNNTIIFSHPIVSNNPKPNHHNSKRQANK